MVMTGVKYVTRSLLVAGLVMAALASSCGSSSGGGGTGTNGIFGRAVKWTCSFNNGDPLTYDYCDCYEDPDGSVDAKCEVHEYQCCWAQEDALTDGGWRPHCQCITPSADASDTCHTLATDPAYQEDDEYTRNLQMVESCAVQ